MANRYIERMEELRHQAGLSKTRMGEICDVGGAEYRKKIKNDVIPTLDTIERICKGMDISIPQFFASTDIFDKITPNMKELICLYMSCDSEGKEMILDIARYLSARNEKKTKKPLK